MNLVKIGFALCWECQFSRYLAPEEQRVFEEKAAFVLFLVKGRTWKDRFLELQELYPKIHCPSGIHAATSYTHTQSIDLQCPIAEDQQPFQRDHTVSLPVSCA